MSSYVHAERRRSHVSPASRGAPEAAPAVPGCLQRALNQRPAVQRVAQQRAALQARGAIVQRLVASASEGATDDRVFQNTTLVAHTMVGGKIKRLSTIDFTKDFAGPGEALAVTAHGSINKVGDYTGEEVATRLVDPKTGLPDGSHDVHFQSCFAAVDGPPSGAASSAQPVTPTSVISVAKAALTERAQTAGWSRVPEVTGSAGPQIFVRGAKAKGPGFDLDKVVVDPARLPIARLIQNVLVKAMEPVKDQVAVNFGGEGADFVKQAEQDDSKVAPLKKVFIELVRGTPANIDPSLLTMLKSEWMAQTSHAGLASLIFDKGVDLRPKQETVTL